MCFVCVHVNVRVCSVFVMFVCPCVSVPVFVCTSHSVYMYYEYHTLLLCVKVCMMWLP